MADPITNPELDEPAVVEDVDMEGASGDVEVIPDGDDAAEDLADVVEEPPKRFTFLEYVWSDFPGRQTKR